MTSHILIVDEEPTIRAILSLYLQKKGFTVTALSTREALKHIGDTFSLAILDAASSAPAAEENCLKLIEYLKSTDPQINILVFPPLYEDKGFLNRALGAGVKGFMEKTGGLDKLFAEVNRWAGGT